MHNAIFGVKFFQKPVLVEVYMQGMNNIICFFDRAELFFLESFVTQWVNIFLDELLIIDYLAEFSFISFWTIDCSIHVANCCIGCRKDLYGLKISDQKSFVLSNFIPNWVARALIIQIKFKWRSKIVNIAYLWTIFHWIWHIIWSILYGPYSIFHDNEM